MLRRFDDTKPEKLADEYPLHTVRISKPFYLGAHEVTLGQFLKFYNDVEYRVECERDGKGGGGYLGSKNGFGDAARFVPWSWGFEHQTMNHPVVNVTWNDAIAFCEWLTKKEGSTYRLPSEAEWEYACKAGSKTRFWFGNDPEDLVRHANVADRAYLGLYANPPKSTTLRGNDSFAFSAPVGSFPANPFGLFDMHGNVYEWCSDWYDPNYYARSPTVNPSGPETGNRRVIRGGGWSSEPSGYRSTYRFGVDPAYRSVRAGFRVVRNVEPNR